MRRFAGVLFIVCAFSGALWAQVVPRGPEFQVNTYTTGNQGGPSVASDAAGNFVVVWASYGQDGSNWGVFGRRFDCAAAPLGPDFQVNTVTTGDQIFPSVASDANGNFVVVWQTWDQDDIWSGIVGRRFDSTGSPAGPEFHVNSHTAGFQEGPSVASDPSGNFVVVWSSTDQDGSGWGGFGQRFDSTGAPSGPEFQINAYTTGAQAPTSVAMDADGDFVVVWNSYGQDGSEWGVFGRRFDAAGAPLSAEFQVNTYTTFAQDSASVASDANGDFVVAWQSWEQDGFYSGIFGQRFDAAGVPLGPEFPVNVYAALNQSSPSIASDATGDLVVTWSSEYQDGSLWGAFGRRFDSSGLPTGSEFQINTFTTGSQGSPSIASDATGNFVVAWDSPDQDGSQSGVLGRRFFGVEPMLINPLPCGTMDCSDPRTIRPTLTWNHDLYNRFRVYIGWDPAFGTGNQVTSGDTLLGRAYWTPSVKKWRKACAHALALNPASPTLYVKLYAVATTLPKRDPARKMYSDVVQVNVQP